MDNELKKVLIEQKIREARVEREKRDRERSLRDGEEVVGYVDPYRESALSAEAYMRHVSKLKRGNG